jgi:hypothetical protein
MQSYSRLPSTSKFMGFNAQVIGLGGLSPLTLVARWFGEITRKRMRRGVFKSVKELIKASHIT